MASSNSTNIDNSFEAFGTSLVTAALRSAGCVYAEEEAAILCEAASGDAELAFMVRQRTDGFPLEHVVGWVQFCGLRITVGPGVFVPRRRTELLARRAATAVSMTAAAHPVPRPAIVVDLACGCAAVGCAVAALASPVDVHAVDIDPVAVACARRNLDPIGGQVYLGDLFQPLPVQLRGHVDVVVANVPYVPSTALDLLPREARLYEPSMAHDGGEDGLTVARRMFAQVTPWLAPGGFVLIETSAGQANAARDAMRRRGLIARIDHDEDLDATVIIGRRQAISSHP